MRYEFDKLAEAAEMTPQALAAHLGISGSTWKKYRTEGMSEVVADRRAAQCGFVAWQVWPEMLEQAMADEKERRRQQRNAQNRRAYWKNPEKHRARSRRYREEARAYSLARQRRWYQQNAERERQKRRERYRASKRGDILDVKDVA